MWHVQSPCSLGEIGKNPSWKTDWQAKFSTLDDYIGWERDHIRKENNFPKISEQTLLS